MLQLALAFALGNGWVQVAPRLDSPWIATAALCAALVLATPLRRPLILAFLLGIVWVLWNAHGRLAERLPLALEGGEVLIHGHIASIPEQDSYGMRFRFDVEDGKPLPPHIELTWYGNTEVHSGEHWQLRVRLRRPHGFANPGGHDYEKQLFREHVSATGYVRESADNRRLQDTYGRYALLRTRAALVRKIEQALPQHPQQGVIRGLVVGDQQAIGSDQWRLFARTGITHLIAISGLHIGMIAMLAAWLGSRLIYWPPLQRWRITKLDLQAICGLLAAFAYSLLAGMSVPTQRTLVMLCVFFGSQLLRRHIDVWQGFGIALLAVILLDPFALLAVGTWLSFGAVALIVLNLGSRLGRPRLLQEFLQTQAAVTVGLVPLLIAAFGSLSLVSPLANVFAIPLYTLVIVPLALLGTLTSCVWPSLGTELLRGCGWLLAHAQSVLEWLASPALVTWHLPQPSFWALALMLAGVGLLVTPLIWPMRYCGFLLCLPAMCWQVPRPPDGAFTLTLLDVGQGLAAVVRTREHVLLYDAGPAFRTGRDTGELVVMPFLHATAVRTLDAAIASHGDADHVGGLRSVLAEMPSKRLLLGPSVHGIPGGSLCTQGDSWHWDGVEFRILHPEPYVIADSDNNSSCVLQISGAGGRVLLTGDIEKPTEHRLLGEHLISPTELVVAAHHGSRSSSTPEFVAAVRARYVLISAGYRNRWGFPKPEVVERWQDSGAKTLSTVTSGAITVTFGTDGLAVPQEYRKLHAHYWQTQ